jgi:glutamate synthase (NADPH) small chain
MGTYSYVKGGFAGEDLPGVYEALPYLISNIDRELGLGKGSRALHRHARQARRRARRRRYRHGLQSHGDPPGRESVTCTYRRDEDNMPGSRRDYKNSKEEGVTSCSIASPSKSSAPIA